MHFFLEGEFVGKKYLLNPYIIFDLSSGYSYHNY